MKLTSARQAGSRSAPASLASIADRVVRSQVLDAPMGCNSEQRRGKTSTENMRVTKGKQVASDSHGRMNLGGKMANSGHPYFRQPVGSLQVLMLLSQMNRCLVERCLC